MKIALIIHELIVQGGGERQCLALASALTRAGESVTIYTSEYAADKCYPNMCSGVSIRAVGRGPLPFITRPLFLRRLLDMQSMTKKIKDPYDVWNPHHWPAHWASTWLKRRLGGRVVWMCNDVPDLPIKASPPSRSGLWGRISAGVYRLLYRFDFKQVRNIDKVVVLSNWTKAEFLKVYPGSVEVIRSGIDAKWFQSRGDRGSFRMSCGVSDEVVLVLWFGIFMPHRRLEDAIEAIAILRKRGHKVRLLLAGSAGSFPQYVQKLKKLVEDRGLEASITFSGPFGERRLVDALAGCDVFIFPNDQQTWGLTVMEAMAAGKPVIVSRGSGVHEVLEDHLTALLVNPRDPSALAGKLELLIQDPEFRAKLATRGREYIISSFSWEKYAADMRKLFEEAVFSEY